MWDYVIDLQTVFFFKLLLSGRLDYCNFLLASLTDFEIRIRRDGKTDSVELSLIPPGFPGKTPQISPVDKSPHPVLQPVEKHVIQILDVRSK